MSSYRYRINGIVLESEFAFPELVEHDGPATGRDVVRVVAGTVPASLPSHVARGACYQTTREACLYTMPGVASYLIEKGQHITVEAAEDGDAEGVRRFLLGPVMTALGFQRGMLVLSGSCVAVADEAVLFIAFTGTGKSTLAALLWKAGHPFVADDAVWIDVAAPDGPLAYPSFPRLELYPDEIERLGFADEQVHLLRTGLAKRSVDVRAHAASAPVRLRRIVRLKREETGEVPYAYRRFDGVEQLGNVMEYGLHAHYIRRTYGQQYCFAQCARLINSVAVGRLTYTAGHYDAAEVLSTLENVQHA